MFDFFLESEWLRAALAVVAVALVAVLAVWSARKFVHSRRRRRIRQDAIAEAVKHLGEKERFEWSYRSGRYRHRGAIPRTLDPALMTVKELARRDDGIGEFSPDGRYLDPPERAWD